MNFKYNRTKELFSFFIDSKGTFCSNGEIIATLWENEGNKKKSLYLRDLCSDLFHTFKLYGIENAIHKEHSGFAISPDKISCDHYQWLQRINSYRGEYMSQKLGELTHAGIEIATYFNGILPM